MELKCVNINDAFHKLVSFFQRFIHEGNDIITKTTSRNGSVWQVAEPVTVTYVKPAQRVLFNRARNANPFFHLYEALWMLAGRRDVAPLKFYNSKIDQFSDDGKTFNGAYGYRWRHAGHHVNETLNGVGHFKSWGEADQLSIIANHLKALPNSRRAVLNMWNVEDDLLRIGPDREDCPISVTSKDVCCLAGETKFRSPEGNYDIATLADRFQSEKGYKFPVYTIDTVTGDQRLSWMTAAWKTGVKKTVVLRFDDGSSVRLTRDHVVFKKTKIFEGKRCIGILVTECQVGDLILGDRLLAEMPENASARTMTGGYRAFKRNVFHNTSWDNLVREHREYYELISGEPVSEDEIHHRNENPSDNRSENLVKLDEVSHQRLHKMGHNNPHCKMSNKDKANRGRIHSAVMQSGGRENTPPHIRAILNKRPPYRSEEDNNSLWEWVCSISNHKIVAIEDGGVATVYDFTVPGRHNAVLSNGVLVHNCNLNVMFSIRETRDREEHEDSYSNPDEWLDMTVINRSNDMIWGMLGANYVHFSILQEYMAAKIGVGVGKYTQFTNNLHVYDWNWNPEYWMNEYSSRNDWRDNLTWYEANEATKTIPLVNDIQAFDKELPEVVRLFDGTTGLQDMNGLTKTSETIAKLKEPFFKHTAAPMFVAWAMQKLHMYDLARYWCSQIKSPDWRKACSDWIYDKENGKVQPKPSYTAERELYHGGQEGVV